MKVGIIGLGMVGDAVQFGLRRLGHSVFGFDTNPNIPHYPVDMLLQADAIFVCVPTPTVNGQCDTHIVDEVVHKLNSYHYQGLVIIKSTVTPGTTERLRKATALRMAFCPEFLRERARYTDFYEDHELCIAGVFCDADAELIKDIHGSLPKHFVQMSSTEAELAKYFVNCFNAQRVVFANAFYEVCQRLEADYATIKDAVTQRKAIPPDYLTCNEGTRAFGGACLPKDTMAFAYFVKALRDVPLAEVFETIVRMNDATTMLSYPLKKEAVA